MKNERSSAGLARAAAINREKQDSELVGHIIERGRQRAEMVCAKYEIFDKLGLKGNETYLFKENLALRIIRTDNYDMTFISRLPQRIDISRIPLFSRLVKLGDDYEKASRTAEGRLRESIDKVAAIGEEQVRIINRTVELAVNDLVARSTIRQPHQTRLGLNYQMIDEWYPRWQAQIGSLRQNSGIQN
ncbi:MAG: hypothetical protein A2798_00035 [Candidatus Levybacteria bacterium RIFCSPHIGHO2_01_FULL_37_17]|nr:MAG: hypothetical protein A2798_00035 [Candidatus Levybacteria bacterium RIFCSPHIGHO2_01_FULL_37_17]OGH36516.1 MAG: hypothetical protein A2959_03330 [Candidatus Levybacteria bacterium RIFCSPLOWO2_01_FULL_38_23]